MNTRRWLLDGRETTAITIRDSCQPRRDIITLSISLMQICYLLHCRPFLIQLPGLGRVLLHQRCRWSFWYLNTISVFLFSSSFLFFIIFIFYFLVFPFLVSLTFYAFGSCFGMLAIFLGLDCIPDRKTVKNTTERVGKRQL